MGRTSVAAKAQRQVNVVAGDREAAIAAMNAATKKKLIQVEKMIADSRESNLRFYHKLGQTCHEVRTQSEVYTDSGYRLIEQAMATQKRVLRKARLFYELYKPEKLQELIDMVNERTGYRLHWGHVTYLLGINTETQRSDWAAKAVKNLWDPPALHAAIKKARGFKAGTGGRPHQIPPTVHMQIRQMMEVSRNWMVKRSLWDGEEVNVFANVVNEPPDEIHDLDLENLKATREYVQDMVAQAGAMVTQLDECIAWVEEVFVKREEDKAAAEAREAAAGKQHRSIDLNTQGGKLNKKRAKSVAR